MTRPIKIQRVCVKFDCYGIALRFMRCGESHQTDNGFFVIKIDGWYCPNCGGSYGGYSDNPIV